MDLFAKFEKYLKYYDLCEDGRKSLREAVEKICADEYLCAEALRLKNRIVNPSLELQPHEEFRGKSSQFGALVFTLAIEDIENFFDEKNIPQDILIDTVNDLGVWINNHHARTGEWGFTTYSWLLHHVHCTVFKLGRLQFEIKNVIDMPPKEFGLDIKEGEPFLEVHVQQGGSLDEAECLASFEWAKEFFPKYLDYDFKVFGCFTWLFDPLFETFLPTDSNILKFQRLFPYRWVHDHEAYWGLYYIFTNITKDNIKDAPTDTYLRKKIVEHLLAGGKMQIGGGYRLS